VTRILDGVQSLLLTAASTVHIWRDTAIAILAGLVILALWLYTESTSS
jgi:hypothetical protein